jgi:hypothetical protein
MALKECSETSDFIIQTPGKYPEESIPSYSMRRDEFVGKAQRKKWFGKRGRE